MSKRIPLVSPIVIPTISNNKLTLSPLFFSSFATRNHNVIKVSKSEKFVAFPLRSENAKDIIENAINGKIRLSARCLLSVRKYRDNVLYTRIPTSPAKAPNIKSEI
jgi:hypothetical protein